MADILDWVSLSLVPGLGVTGLRRLVDYFDGPDRVLLASAKERSQVAGIRAEALLGLSDKDEVRNRGKKELERLAGLGAQAVCLEDQHYPSLLRQTNSPPPVLYVLGRIELLGTCCVAIVGSRAATSYGRRIASTLARDLAARGVTVVSGLALGIDAEAHAGALSASGATIGVLGCGLDVIYPQQNSRLYEQILGAGLLVTEYPLGTTPEGFRFPARNRIISGMSYGVVVVEAARKSGSLITAELALDEGRDVFAVPGQVDSFKSAGAHWLLQQGAKLVISARDILEELPLCSGLQGPENGVLGVGGEPESLDPPSLALLEQIEPYAMKRDALIAGSGLSPGRVAEFLLLLELEGLVEMLPGDEVRRVVRERKE
ncbi:MAG: DNA-processing protein DprA [Desulfocapsaceae bacterium]|jgi:DNA processing protein|nr:DNA-processing protein DprA [Desulfocapsaceae bacterium]